MVEINYDHMLILFRSKVVIKMKQTIHVEEHFCTQTVQQEQIEKCQ